MSQKCVVVGLPVTRRSDPQAVRPVWRPALSAAVALAAALIFVAAAGKAAERQSEGFLAARANAIRLYGNHSPAQLEQLYRDATAEWEKDPAAHRLQNRAIYAELSGALDVERQLLLGLLAENAHDAGLVKFVIERSRSHGSIRDDAARLAAAAGALDGADRLDAVKMLAHAFLWQKPPSEVEALARGEAAGRLDLGDRVYFAGAFASWGMPREAEDLVTAPLAEGRTDDDGKVFLVAALSEYGLKREARAAVGRVMERVRFPAGREGADLEEIYEARLEMLEPLAELARAGGAWDVFLSRTAADASTAPPWQVLQHAAALELAGLPVERAEAMGALHRREGTAKSQSLFGGALLKAGDAYAAQSALLAALMREGGTSQYAYLDALDAILVLRDVQMLSAAMGLLTLSAPPPQSLRMMSELTRLAGDLQSADRHFQGFIRGSGMGEDSRFSWEGNRLLAEYYLDTGRLEAGREAARRALAQLLDTLGPRALTRSPQPARFVALFKRTESVDELLDYARSRKSEFPDSTLLSLLEAEALIELQRADEALAVVAALYSAENASARKIAAAEASRRLGRTTEAVALYEEAIAAGATLPVDVLLDLAGLYAEFGSWRQAEDLLAAAVGREGPALWLTVGDFFATRGRHEQAARAFGRMDDMSIGVSPEALGVAARFMVERGDYGGAARLLERRIAAQTAFDPKAAFITEAMPRKSASAAGYLVVGPILERGRLGRDGQLMAHFYRSLCERAEMLLDARTAQAAAGQSVRVAPHDLRSMMLFVSVTRAAPSEETLRAAETVLATLPLTPLALVLADVEFALGRADAAVARMRGVMEGDLTRQEAYAAIDILASRDAPGELAGQLAARAEPSWPWVLRARLAQAALSRGAREVALKEAAAAASGASVGRALWAADFYLAAGMPAEAAAVIERFFKEGDHPALRLRRIRVAEAAGDAAAARAAADTAGRALRRPPYVSLFDVEAAHLAAPR